MADLNEALWYGLQPNQYHTHITQGLPMVFPPEPFAPDVFVREGPDWVRMGVVAPSHIARDVWLTDEPFPSWGLSSSVGLACAAPTKRRSNKKRRTQKKRKGKKPTRKSKRLQKKRSTKK